ncbi:nucleotide exchange factor sil1 [Metarhizium acridum]|nr:nucleotide exchange factor sil1 [Metarhizium acridum]
MPGSRSKPNHLPMMLAMVVGLILCIFSAPSIAHDSNSSNAPKPDLICHTSNPDECYPRVFQPTEEFQIVHDDQELPNGLHVRLNIWTGQKEAKINVPGEADPSLEGLPVDQAVVMVDPEEQRDGPKIPKGAPEYEPVGKVMGPEHESAALAEGLNMLKSGISKSGQAFDDALETLEDLSHDMYYGLKIAQDTEAIEALLCLMCGQSAPTTDGADPHDQQAASILAGVFQNNPAALKEVTAFWSQLLVESRCPNTGKSLHLRLYSSVEPSRNGDGANAQQAAARVKSKVAVINGLIKDGSIRKHFLREGGMESLLKVLIPEDKAWARAQRKVGQLVLDNFLDENMGAALGEWPYLPKLGDEICQTEDSGTAEGCWDYHVARIMKSSSEASEEEEDWSRQLNDRLVAARKEKNNERKHEEL